jgi:dTMP kinase
MTRARQRAELDRFEEEHVEFFDQVREGYLTRAKSEERFRVIDASQSIDLVQQALRELLLPMLSEAS